MFERFTEKARRVIFYARYEASQYGSTHIDTEHLLLGLAREDRDFTWRFLTCGSSDIRNEIEKVIVRGEHISTAVEIFLTEDAKKVLTIAMDESDRLGHRHVGCEHLFVGLLMVQGTLAARILADKGARLEAVREQLAKPTGEQGEPRASSVAKQTLANFLSAVKESPGTDISFYFAKDARIVNAKGHLWQGFSQIETHAATIFTPYAKRGARPLIESEERGPSETFVANILWQNVTIEGQLAAVTHRMTVMMSSGGPAGWAIFFIQITPVVLP